jgi:hypothetical protein
VQQHPYHIDSLLQLGEFFHMQEDRQTAVDLVGQSQRFPYHFSFFISLSFWL